MNENLALKILLDEYNNGIKNGLYHYTQIVFAYNSNRIEGSKLSKDQTRYIYETNSLLSQKDEIIKINDIIETKNHFKAFDFILDNYNKPLDIALIKNIHSIVKKDTKDSIIGDFKKRVNFIGDTKTTNPKDVEKEIEKLLNLYNSLENIVIEDIIDFHYKFESIHPFEDGNGRTGRLIMFKECLKNNITPFIIDDEHKLFYYRGLKEYENTKGYLVDTCFSCQDKYQEILNEQGNLLSLKFDYEKEYRKDDV
ncbi:Fic family protein [Campylobacter sp. RM12327]|uniref:Fic family protein n=1 Tax=Campylobacter sputorum TaxID=206 RepID=UPI000B784DA2|nr:MULTISPECIES: Fic family protein [Campylobacter]ASM40118.1 Fic domain protein [Campylobacter sputorum]MBE7358762.1 Fic family protein [Campylobacter sp. RM11302]MBF6670055.1 Fic family protein [Campylobacter sp. RM12327]MBF6675183.1 Fic family protein [Campylobacter sp. RM13538]MBF6676795.1 Fic family protein [Campylobacter sp. RM12321]